MITITGFVLAAAVGALARAEAGRRWNRHEGFATGTLVVNVSGSFALGLLWNVAPPMVSVVGLAGLGTFTTFSSFARDAVALVEQRQVARAAGYLALSVGLGVGAAALGVALA